MLRKVNQKDAIQDDSAAPSFWKTCYYTGRGTRRTWFGGGVVGRCECYAYLLYPFIKEMCLRYLRRSLMGRAFLSIVKPKFGCQDQG